MAINNQNFISYTFKPPQVHRFIFSTTEPLVAFMCFSSMEFKEWCEENNITFDTETNKRFMLITLLLPDEGTKALMYMKFERTEIKHRLMIDWTR